MPDTDTALALTGGGARAAYQVGCLRSIGLQMQRINGLLRRLPEPAREGLRPVRVLILRPSRDLGRVAAEHEFRMPRVFRFLQRGLRRRGARSADVLSMINSSRSSSGISFSSEKKIRTRASTRSPLSSTGASLSDAATGFCDGGWLYRVRFIVQYVLSEPGCRFPGQHDLETCLPPRQDVGVAR